MRVMIWSTIFQSIPLLNYRKDTLKKLDQRIEFGTQTYISYQNGDINSTITLHYCYMQQGAATVFVLENADDVVPIIVNGCEGSNLLV